MNLMERWTRGLEALRGEGRYRTLAAPVGIDFSSNDYLGRGAVELSANDTLSRSGMASRLLRGHHKLWDEVEERLAAWHGTQSVLIFNSGYVANEGLLSTIIEEGDWVASDALNHASIIDGCRLTKAARFVFPHNDMRALEQGLRVAQSANSTGRQRFIVTESLFGMEGDRAPLAEMVALAEKYDAQVIVDEAHATGCFGKEGSGLVDELCLRQRILASVHTGGKALGVPGAYICGSRLLRDILVNRCRHLIFTTALPSMVAQWWLDALAWVRYSSDARQSLSNAAAVFRDALMGRNIVALGSDHIVPIVVGSDHEAVQAAARLQAEGFDIRAIRPPTVPPGSARLRISIHANHDEMTLRDAADAVARALGRETL